MPFDLGGYTDFDWSSLGDQINSPSYYNPGYNNYNFSAPFDFANVSRNDWNNNQDFLSTFLNNSPTANPDFSSFMSSNPYAGTDQNTMWGPPEEPMTALEKYKNSLDNIPKRSDYKPGFWRNLGAAGLAGVTGATRGVEAGLKVGQAFADKPFNDAMGDWSTENASLRQGAEQERLTDYQKGVVGARNTLNDIRAAKAPAEIKQLMSKAGLEDARAQDIADGKSVILKTRDGYVQQNLKTGETTPLGFDDKNMTPEEKMQFQKTLDEMTTNRQLKVASAYGNNALNLENARQQNREANIETEQGNKLALQNNAAALKNKPEEIKPGSVNEQRLRARAFNDTIARSYSKYSALLDQTPDGRYVINPEKASTNKELYQSLLDDINTWMRTNPARLTVGKP